MAAERKSPGAAAAAPEAPPAPPAGQESGPPPAPSSEGFDAPPGEPPQPAPAEDVPVRYVVAPGVSIFGSRGVVAEGETITPEHFDSPERFDELVERGTIVRRS